MIELELSDIRRKLIDLTRNNRLLNHHDLGQRTLQIVDEMPADVYRTFVDEERMMQFLSREEAPRKIGETLSPQDPISATAPDVAPTQAMPLAPLAAEGPVANRRRDQNLQTLLSDQKLQTRLVHLAREASSALQEMGCNILYLTLGLVEWRDAEQSSVVNRAPLVFVPAELKRKSVNTRYALHLFDDDIIANPSLIEMCQSQFRLEVPSFDPEKDDLLEYFAKVGRAVQGSRGWRFVPGIFLGLYSFSKLLMYRDLDPRNWPDGTNLTAHPMIQCLSGLPFNDPHDGDGLPDPHTLDQTVKPSDCFQIVDADSSQQTAILAAKRGLSMVIDGPPGTGKSQTITNIIAECLAQGQTVLFVAEKATALDVVKRRLEKRGLADFVLELHSRQASKKAVLSEIGRVLEKEAFSPPIPPQTADELLRTRQTLNSYHRDLHEPLGALQISPFVAMSRAIGLSAQPEAVCDIPDVMAWTAQQLADARERLQTLDRRLARVGNVSTHPWRGIGLDSAGLKEKQRIGENCQELISAIHDFLREAAQLASELSLPAPISAKTAAEQIATTQILLDSPPPLAPAILDQRWNTLDPILQSCLAWGTLRQLLKPGWLAIFKPEAEEQDWLPVHARRLDQAFSILRFLKPSWYADSRRLKSFTLDGRLPPVQKQIELLAVLIKSRILRRQIEPSVPGFFDQFGPAWRGIDSDWSALADFAKRALALRQLVLSGCVDAAAAFKIVSSSDRTALISTLSAAANASKRFQICRSNWLAAIASDEKQWLADWESADLSAVAVRLADLPGKMELLDDWVDLRQSNRQCINSPLKSFVEWALGNKGEAARSRLADTFARHFYRLWVEESFLKCQTLRGFRGQDHNAVIDRFRTLDEQWIDMTRHRLAARLAARRPEINTAAHRQSKLGLIQAEVRKKTRHMPLRKLLKEAGEVVQAVKPCFMMSPLSVAQYLAPGGPEFDVVIFDEASQVEPADALGAVARGRQLLLVGDEKQLPPTNFFDRLDPEEVDDSDDFQSPDVRSGDLESILSLGIVRLRHRCALRWHYRSRHSTLIEFSNQQFYDGRLRVFPSPHTDCSEMGLAFHYVENAVYMRGAGRFNPVEAKIVAAAVIQHAIDRPKLSLGVGTLNQPQQRAIEDELELLRRQSSDPRVEQFFADHLARGEEFFVKNLESIQGDERDVIFLSIGFGKDQNGRPPVSFGALNRDGGWRRLNVLITRARQRCVVYSSVRHDEIDLGKTHARGVIALKGYLYAAEHGRIKEMAVAGADHDSEFEATVCSALRDLGWEVHAQVGCAGFAIDLAVVDPRAPGRYLLGIECDGATYHSSPTARDRDRLRQEVLEDLGWKIHRIWSTDWFQRPTVELEKLAAKLDELKLQPPTDDLPKPSPPPEPEPPPPIQPAPAPAGELPHGVARYIHHRDAMPARASISTIPPEKLAKIVCKLVAVEGPIHREEAARAVAEMFSVKATSRPREAFDRALTEAIAAGSIIPRGDFLWMPGNHEVQVRFRGDDCPVTTPELIAPEEFEAAIKLVVRQQFGLKFDALPEAAIRVLGFARAGPKLKTALEEALIRLDRRGEIHQDNSGFVTMKPNIS